MKNLLSKLKTWQRLWLIAAGLLLVYPFVFPSKTFARAMFLLSMSTEPADVALANKYFGMELTSLLITWAIEIGVLYVLGLLVQWAMRGGKSDT